MAWDTTAEGLRCDVCEAVFPVGSACACKGEAADKPKTARKRKRKRRSKAVVSARGRVPAHQKHLLELDGCAAELILLNDALLMGIIKASAHSSLVKAIGKLIDLHQSGKTLERVEELEQRLADLDAKLEAAQGGAVRADMATTLSVKASERAN
jgi:hypothetical protein